MCVISAVFEEEWKEVCDEERRKRPALLDVVDILKGLHKMAYSNLN